MTYLTTDIRAGAGQETGTFLRRGDVESDGAKRSLDLGDPSTKIAYTPADLSDVTFQQG